MTSPHALARLGLTPPRYASVTLNETSANLAIELLRAGLARVKPQGSGRAESDDVRELTAAEGEPHRCAVAVLLTATGSRGA